MTTLLSAAQYAAEQLAKLPAFGDSIGDKVSKAELGVAHNKLKLALANNEEPDERDKQIVEMARQQHESEGTLEIDDCPVVSEGEDNGAYVQAWVWVDFSDTPLDKEAEEEEETAL